MSKELLNLLINGEEGLGRQIYYADWGQIFGEYLANSIEKKKKEESFVAANADDHP